MEYSKHTSYFFIPIWMDASDSFRDLIDAIDSSEQWMLRHDEIRYMLKFVADKIDSSNEERRLIFHYLLRYGCRKTYGLPGVDQCFETVGAFPFRESGQPIRFQVVDAHLFCFSTRVCILAFQVVFDNQTPAWVADALFALKRASIPLKLSGQEGGTVTSMLDIARQMMSQFSQISGFSVFGYANPNTERSNVLTYLEVADHPSYEKELFYLRNCYHVGIPYVPNEELDKQQTFQASQDVVWGTSPEAAVCLACPDRGDRVFTENVFFENFNSQYLVMYILLLHQKYALYMFLTELGVGRYNTLETLESYRQRLYEFKTDFVFSFITEVPQYQNLYSNMMQAFALEHLYQDVQEPLVSLAEIRRESEDEKQKRRDASVNSALGLLSVLGFFSILVDGVDFLDFLLGGCLTKTSLTTTQLTFVGLIALIFLVVFVRLLLPPKARQKKKPTQKRPQRSAAPESRNLYVYTGCFVSQEELLRAADVPSAERLENLIPQPHVTFQYRPGAVDTSLFGKRVGIRAVGYGNDGTNEGLQVELSSEDPVLRRMIADIPTPHITISVSGTGKPVNTRHLTFQPIKPVELKGTFGAMAKTATGMECFLSNPDGEIVCPK